MWKKLENSVKPSLVDETSSKNKVYVRRNIVETEKEVDGEKVTVYEYEEAIVTKADYPLFAKQQSDIDFIAVMTGVDLDE